MNSPEKIILCQPDSRKGCSICCGLFNMPDCSKPALSPFLEKGAARTELCGVYSDFCLDDKTRDSSTHVCPYQGFLGPGKPGCLIHPLSSGAEGRDRSLFAHKICSEFLCPAHAILTMAEKKTLISHVNDWFLYSIAITDPETFSFLLQHITSAYAVGSHDHKTGLLLNAGLSAHAELLIAGNDTLFYYSQPEYIMHREKFCIRYNCERRNTVMEKIRETAAESALYV